MIYTQLRSFHAVAAEGGFTAASKILNVGQPTITTQVRALEDHYAIELFHRRGRSVTLTDAGRGLFAISQRLMALEAEARDYLNALGGFQTGRLKLGAVGPYHVTEMLAAFNARYPELKLSVTIGNSREVLANLVDFHTDIAVLTHIEEEVEADPRFLTLPYSRHEIVAFMRKDHRLAKRRSIRLGELAGERMVLREEGSTTRRLFEAVMARVGVEVDPVVELGSREAVWLAVQRGLGVGVVADIEFIAHPDLVTVPLTGADLHTTDHVVCLAERRDSRLIRAFLAVVEEVRGGD